MTLRITQQGICIIDCATGLLSFQGWDTAQDGEPDDLEAARDAVRIAIIDRAMCILAEELMALTAQPDAETLAHAMSVDVILRAKQSDRR